MSMALIFEAHDEVRKLLIAGSEMAVDNSKLKKILPGMRKSGESVPVFAKLADAIEVAINPGTGKSQEKLLELANLINAVVYTQGETGVQGKIEKVDTAGLDFLTEVSYRKLNPVISALTTKGSGRLEVIRQFFAESFYKDLRLVVPLISALGDGYSEIADLAYEVLKKYGDSIIHVLKKSLNMNGSKGDARIIELISDLNGKKEKEFYLDAIEKGSIEVKVSSIKVLKDFPECEDLLIELSNDKKKEVREAAFYALGKIKSGSAVKCLFNAFRGKDRDIVSEPIRENDSQEIVKSLLEEAEKSMELIMSSDTGNKSENEKLEVEYFVTVLDCMLGKRDNGIFEFLKKCIDLSKKLTKFKINNADDTIIRTSARNILAFESYEAYDFLVSTLGKYNNSIIEFSLEAAIRSKSSEYVFENYSPLMENGKKSFERSEIIKVMSFYCDFDEAYRIQDYYYSNIRNYYINTINKYNIRWDKRWAKLLLSQDEISLGCKLISRGDMNSCLILLEKLKAHMKFGDRYLNYIILGLFQAGYEKVREEILNVLEFNFNNNKNYMRYYLNDFAGVMKLLPASDVQYIEEFAAKFNNEGTEVLADVTWYLKNKK
ncbi:HEAT repeat domain-containing protein [Acetivibrio cellulolyticus]|uniref:HEAT repeat domain-containing protein n=1 Tax=Acetivibrio cellulolyticus TaxID=35830 RepID=UPI0001E301A3|nr:HEAT repeat domain-containing protein [Acetivibrio cellulolyticus]